MKSKFLPTSRLSLLPLAFAALWALLLGPSALAAPNFVLIIADDVSVDDLGCYGHPTLRTPHIDELAAKGIRLTNAYLTISSCSPTRTSLITGRYPHNTGAPELHMTKSPILETLPQFPAILKDQGYYTVQSGKSHFNGDATKSFEKFYELKDAGPSGAGRWVKCLEERPEDRPFFMWFAAADAHRGWDIPLAEGNYDLADVIVPPYLFDGPMTRGDLANYYNEVSRFDKHVGAVVKELKRQDALDNTVVIVMADNGRPFPRDKTWLYDSGIKTPMVIHWPEGAAQPAVSDSLLSIIDLAPTILDLAGAEIPESMQGVSLQPILGDPSASVRELAFAEKNWHVMRAHERLVRHGNYAYIKNNVPEWIGFHLGHWVKSYSDSYHELAYAWQAGQLPEISERQLGVLRVMLGDPQWDLLRQPRLSEMLFDTKEDPQQLNNLATDPAMAEQLAFMRRALDQWAEDTGDTVPDPEEMTADRVDRETWKALAESGRPNPGEVPGETANAHKINASGPIWKSDVKD